MARAADKRRNRHTNTHPPNSRSTGYAALSSQNFRLYLIGQAVATTGTWVQRIAQDWLVLTLTGSATMVGITTALQWAPMLIFGLFGGWIADHYPKRRVLQTTQLAACTTATLLAGLTLTHHVTAWHVQALAAVTGTIIAIERPVRQALVTDIVERSQIHGAISLTYAVYFLGNFSGPALAGVLISVAGPGWAYALNAASYIAPLTAIAWIDPNRFPPHEAANRRTTPPGETVRPLLTRPEIWQPSALCGVFAMFISNLPVILTTEARTTHIGPTGYSVLASSIALGSLAGGIIAAGRTHIGLGALVVTGYALSAALMLASAMSPLWGLSCALALVGAVSTILFTGTSAHVQLVAERSVRGRVTSIYNIAETGSAALGGPILGLIVENCGPRTGLTLAGAIPAAAVLLIATLSLASKALRSRLAGQGPDRRSRCPTGR
ncbi:MFS transporter [Nocardia sp. NPDC059246]|uniref:MFS transporter n=1 Tax=unclassified Nocardia TaxID=2637762 RepID=UPI003689F46E